MKCIIPGTGIRAFGKSIYCLAKIGDEIVLEASNDSLALKTVNPARSGFGCFEFKRGFFNSFKNSSAISCKILSKCMLSVFRGLSSLEKSVDYCTVNLNTQRDKLTFVFHCKYGIKKTHQLGFEDCETLKAVYSKESSANKVTQCSKPLQEALGSFHGSVSEITISITANSFQLSNFIENQEDDDSRLIKSRITLLPDEFQYYQSNVDTVISFSLKELRAILTFTAALLDPLTVQFDTTGKPVVFSIEDNPCYTADFVLATLAESDIHCTPSQHQSSQQHNTGLSSTDTQRITSTYKHTSNKRKKTNHSNNSLPNSQHNLNKTDGTESLEHENVPPSPESPAVVVVQSDEEHSSVIDLTIQVPDQLSTPIPDDVFSVQSDEDFVEGPRSRSIVRSQDQLTQDSVLDCSGFLPSTPPPTKKFKHIFSSSDMFGSIQDSTSILAPNSEDEDDR